ncbi:MAG: alpha/beta fold hydrolase, partial [Snowella sp.]
MTDSPAFYEWNGYRCAYTMSGQETATRQDLALLMIHPIGVGLSGVFWHRLINSWLQANPSLAIYNPDLLGCGASDMPPIAYYPIDWAAQLKYFIETVVQKPVVLVVQGALFPVAIKLVENPPQSNLIRGLVLSGPPAWRTMLEPGKPIPQKLLWNLFFESPIGLGKAFFRYARRRQFLRSFSVRQLF